MSRPTTPPAPSALATLGFLPPGIPNVPKSAAEPFSSPPRSNTHHHHKSSRPHIPSQPHRTHRHYYTDSTSQVLQSAITGPSHNPFGDFLTKTKSTLADPFPASASSLVGLGGTRTPPRIGDAAGQLEIGNERDSNSNHIQASKEEEEREKKRQQQLQLLQQQKLQQEQDQKLKWSSISHLRHQRNQTTTELNTTLSQLTALSTTTTRRLDYTYYALLTSLSSLRSGITSLHNLAHETRNLDTRFRRQAREGVAAETETVVGAAVEQVKRQGGRIEILEGRLRRGRERVDGLRGRVEAVRGKVERAGEREGERGRRRGLWRVGWGCVVSLFLVGFMAVVWEWGGGGGVVMVGELGRSLAGGVGGGRGGNETSSSSSLWDMPMKEGTLGAEDPKMGLEGLRVGPPLDVDQEQEEEEEEEEEEVLVDTTIPVNDVDALARQEEASPPRQKKTKIDTEKVLRLFDEL